MNETGILNIYKPAGMTSHDVVAIVRRKLGVRRVGHTGTLDPMARGVLPVCVGKAARISEYLDLDFKVYRCSLTLGLITDTQDIWGTTLEERPVDLEEESVYRAFVPFRGVIEQKPPAYSAVRVGGKRLYEYARQGKTVEVKSRSVFIDALEIEKIDLPRKQVDFLVRCSKGTYIRTICQDAGLALGCGAAMRALERTASGVFTAAEAVKLEDFRALEREEALALMLPADFPLVRFGRAVLDEEGARLFVSGRQPGRERYRLEERPALAGGGFPLPVRPEYRRAYRVYADGGLFLGVAFLDEESGLLKADKVLCEVN